MKILIICSTLLTELLEATQYQRTSPVYWVCPGTVIVVGTDIAPVVGLRSASKIRVLPT